MTYEVKIVSIAHLNSKSSVWCLYLVFIVDVLFLSSTDDSTS